MSQDRDPRTDPRRGDTWRKEFMTGFRSRTVTRVDPVGGSHNVEYVTGNGVGGRCWSTTWEAWTRGAELLERGAE